jgi:hypothetical protein
MTDSGIKSIAARTQPAAEIGKFLTAGWAHNAGISRGFEYCGCVEKLTGSVTVTFVFTMPLLRN